MFNHHYEMSGQTHWAYDDKDDAFIVHAEHHISAGDPVESEAKAADFRELWLQT